jgi:hypothetical protein
LGPIKQLADYLTTRIYYRCLPALAREATLAAETIERLGLSRSAVEDPLVLRILEEDSREDDPGMQARWANLLANALTESHAEAHAAFPGILGELQPVEAATLDVLVGDRTPLTFRAERWSIRGLIEIEGFDNLTRLGLLRYSGGRTEVMLTDLGLGVRSGVSRAAAARLTAASTHAAMATGASSDAIYLFPS